MILCAISSALALTAPASASETVTYTYDAQGRLIASVHTGGVNDGAEMHYQFDDSDNRTNVAVTHSNSRVVVVPLGGATVIPIIDP